MKNKIEQKIFNNILIAIEGSDGVGKTTLQQKICNYFKLNKISKPLAAKIGLRNYLIQRQKVNSKKNNDLIDFYIKSYSLVSGRGDVIDRYIGSLFSLGISKKTILYFYKNLFKLQIPQVVVILKTDNDVLAKRLKKRDSDNTDIKKIPLQKKLLFLITNIYKLLNVKIISIDNSKMTPNETFEEFKKVFKNIYSIHGEAALIEFKYYNQLITIGFEQIKSNYFVIDYFDEKIIIDLNDMSKTIAGVLSKFNPLVDMAMIFLMVNLNVKVNVKNILFNISKKYVNENIDYFNFKMDGSFPVIEYNHNFKFKDDVKTINNKDNIMGDFFMDTKISVYKINKKVTQIGDNPFAGTNTLLRSDNKKFIVDEKWLIDKKKKKVIAYLGNDKVIKVPNYIKTLGKHVFYKKLLNTVKFNRNLINIINNPFSHSKTLELTINDNFKVYEGCLYTKDYKILISNFESRTSIKLHKDTMKIGKNAFFGKEQLKVIELNPKLKYIGNNPFAKTGITSIINNSKYFKIKNSTLYSYDYKFLYFCYAVGNITLHNDVEIIGRNSFSFNNNVLNVVVNTGVKEIHRNAFEWCNKLVSIDIPNNKVKLENQGKIFNKVVKW